MESGKSSPALLFDEFLVDLRRRGFTIGVDHHLRLQQLLPRLSGRCSPEDLRSLLCPLFATNERQQEVFYNAFDSFLPLLSVPSQPLEASETRTRPSRPATGRHQGQSKSKKAFFISSAIGVLAILIGMAIWKSHVTPLAKAPPQKISTPSPAPPTESAHPEVPTHPALPEATTTEPTLPTTVGRSVFERLSEIGADVTWWLLRLLSWVARFLFDAAPVVLIFGPIVFFVSFREGCVRRPDR